jgi:hypothetical protein
VTARKPYAGTAPTTRVAVPASAPEAKAESVIVVDQAATARSFDADDWNVTEFGFLEVLKDGKRVATFAPGYTGAYKKSARHTNLPGMPTLVTRW